MTLSIGIAGISGRMGRLVAEEVAAAGAVLAGGLALPEGMPEMPGVFLTSDPDALFPRCRVVIDFTHASAVAGHAAAAARHGVAWVLGTTGLSAADQQAVVQAARQVAVVQAANFSPGVNLVLALAERLAAALPAETYDAEILEMHHRQKVDAPSGTAIALGEAVAKGRGTTLETAGRESGRDGHTGPRRTGTIGFAALRGGQVVGEHSVIFAAASEHIVLTHRAFDRRAYASGAVRAAFWAADQPPGLYSMADVLGMRAS